MGSSRRSDLSSRLFSISVPAIECFFSGTGDMFAALTVVRFREEVVARGLEKTAGWLSEDRIEAMDLPLARAAERVLASMHGVLELTKQRVDEVVSEDPSDESDDRVRLKRVKAAEVRIVKGAPLLRNPIVSYKAEAMVIHEM